MGDKYTNFEELSKNEDLNKDYRIFRRKGKTDSAVIAPHGGNIEPGTTEIGDAIAGKAHSFYTFEGIKPTTNSELHITSTSFDEPQGIKLVKESVNVLALHGCIGGDDIVYIGGLDTALKESIQKNLLEAGFKTGEHDNPELRGINPYNICNRGEKGQGVQLELSAGLRKKMFYSLRAKDRDKKTDLFEKFVLAVVTTQVFCHKDSKTQRLRN